MFYELKYKKKKGDKNNYIFRFDFFRKFHNEYNNSLCNKNNIKNKS